MNKRLRKIQSCTRIAIIVDKNMSKQLLDNFFNNIEEYNKTSEFNFSFYIDNKKNTIKCDSNQRYNHHEGIDMFDYIEEMNRFIYGVLFPSINTLDVKCFGGIWKLYGFSSESICITLNMKEGKFYSTLKLPEK